MPLMYISYDAETGEEIIIFVRRGRLVGMVRDYYTKRFIRGFRGFTVKVALLFEYPPSKATASNPLYVDIKLQTYLGVDEMKDTEEVEKELAHEGELVLEEYFGGSVAKLAQVAGSEHSVEVTNDVYSDYHWYLVWHHYKRDEREKDGIGTIGKISSPES